MNRKIIKNGLIVSNLVLVIFILIFIIYAYTENTTEKRINIKNTSTKIIILGFDALTWNVIDPLIEQGKLSNFERLMREGSYGSLKTCCDTWSSIVWTTIATGKNPKKHGIEGFVVKFNNSYETIPVTSNLRKVKAIWNILSENNNSVGINGWFVTWPPEDVNGILISDRFPKLDDSIKPEKEFIYYRELLGNISLKKIKEYNITSDFCNIYLNYLNSKTKDCQNYRIERTLEFFIEFINKNKNLDLLALYTHHPDSIQHWYFEDFGKDENDIIKESYIKFDNTIGKIISNMNKDDIIIILSDHGAERIPLRYHFFPDINKILEELKLLEIQNNEINWNNTLAYGCGNKEGLVKGICLNIRNREPYGIINPNEVEENKRYVMEKILSITTEDLEPVTSKIIIDEELLYYKNPEYRDLKQEGDIIIEFMNIRDKTDQKLIINNKKYEIYEFFPYARRSAEHSDDGALIMHGKNIKRGYKIKDSSVYDITPTILYLIGYPVARDMDGRVLKEAINVRFKVFNPVRYIETYEDKDKEIKEEEPIKSRIDKEIIEELKSLGYIQ